jgi:hypothetical protein
MGKVIKIIAGVALIGLAIIGGPLTIGGAFAFLGTISGGAIFMMGASLLLAGLAPGAAKIPKAQLGRLNVSMDVNAPRKFVLGTTAFPLDLRYHEGTGTDQEYIHYIIAHAAHEVASIDEIWFEQDQAWTAGGGVTSKYSGYLTVTTRTLGAAGNEIAISGNWGAGERLTGCAYTYIKIKRTGNSEKSESPLVSGLPSRVTVIGQGALLYDPRLDSTVTGGSGAHRSDDQSTWGVGYSPADSYDNPALQVLWFLLGWKINGKLSVGSGVPAARIDMESFIEAANLCDEAVTLAAGGTQERYRSSGAGSDADDRMGILKNLLTACNGTLRDVNGRISLTVIKNDLADYVLDLADDDVLDDFQFQQTLGLTSTYNVVRGSYVDPSNNSLYQLVDYPEVSLTSPDGIERVLSLDLGYVEDANRAQRIAKQALQRNQYRGTFQAVFSAKALGCEVGEIIRLSFEPLGWSNKLFRVTAKQIGMDGRVPLTLLEENAAIYAWDAEEVAAVTATAPTVYDPLNSPFILADVLAQLTANAKAEVYYQAAPPPTSVNVDDLWYNTTDGKWYISRAIGADQITAGEWELVEDADIAVAQAAAVAAQDAADLAQADATQAIADAAGAQGTADGKVTTFFQASAPSAEGIGDLWIDTDDGNLLYRAGAAGTGSWVAVQDTDISTAITNAATAQTTADGKIVSFYQAAAPTAEGVGDLWTDTDDSNQLYRWDGGSWVSVRDATIAAAQADASQAITDAATAQGTADGKVTTFIQATAPSAEGIGDLWIDSDDGNKLYRATAAGTGSWVEIQDAAISTAITNAATAQSTADGKIVSFYQASAPTAVAEGDFWIDTDDGNRLYRWNGTTWIDGRDTTIAAAQADASTAITDAATAQGTADGKVTTFVQASAPTAEGEGDLWLDSDDGNKLYRATAAGTGSWVAVPDAGIATAISDAATAQSTADGKIISFYQASAPTAEAIGDFWTDTDDNNKLYRWNGATWISVRDATIAAAQADATQALADAVTAQTTADSKVDVFYQDAVPTSVGINDLWFKTDTEKWYIAEIVGANEILAGEWVLTQDASIGVAILDAATAQATADGKITTYLDNNEPYPVSLQVGSPTADSPSLTMDFTVSFSDGDLWLDTNDGNKLHRWGKAIAAWIEVQDTKLTGIEENADVTATAVRTIEAAFPVIEIKEDEAGHTGTRTVAHTLYVGITAQTGVTWSIQTNDTGGTCTVDSGTGVVSLSGIAVSGAYTIRAAKGGFNTDKAVNVTYVPTPASGSASALTGSASNSTGYGTTGTYTQLLALTLTGTPIGRMFFNTFGFDGGSKSAPNTFSGSNGTWQARLKLSDGGTVTYPVETTALSMVSGSVLQFADFSALFSNPLTVAVGGTVTVSIEVKRTAGDANILTASNSLDVNVIAT